MPKLTAPPLKDFRVRLKGVEGEQIISAHFVKSDGGGTRLFKQVVEQDAEGNDRLADQQVAFFYSGQCMSCYPVG